MGTHCIGAGVYNTCPHQDHDWHTVPTNTFSSLRHPPWIPHGPEYFPSAPFIYQAFSLVEGWEGKKVAMMQLECLWDWRRSDSNDIAFLQWEIISSQDPMSSHGELK